MRGSDGTLYTRAWSAGSAGNPGGWGPFSQLGSDQIVGAPVAIARGADQLDVFTVGADRAIHVRSWSGSPPGSGQPLGGKMAWSADRSLGGQVIGTPSVVSGDASHLAVFARGTDGALWAASFHGGSWSAMTQVGPEPFLGNPSAVASGLGRIDVFVRGTDDALHQKTWRIKKWLGYKSLGGVLRGDPTAVSRGANEIHVFVKGTDNALYQTTWNGTAWSGFAQLDPTHFHASPAAIATPNGLEVFVRGDNSRLCRHRWNGSVWDARQDLLVTTH